MTGTDAFDLPINETIILATPSLSGNITGQTLGEPLKVRSSNRSHLSRSFALAKEHRINSWGRLSALNGVSL